MWIRYHGDWKSETQTVVSLLAFMHWLETGTLVLHSEVEEKLGCKFFSVYHISFSQEVLGYFLGQNAFGIF